MCTSLHADICSDLPSLTNGAVTYSTGSPNNRPVNTVAMHTCNNGYTLSSDPTSTRNCVIRGIWSGSTLSCVGELVNIFGCQQLLTLYSLQLMLHPPPALNCRHQTMDELATI